MHAPTSLNRSAPHPRVSRPGFTLLELMVVVVVGGIVTAMATPKVRDLMVQQRVARAATSIQNDLEAAFAIATRNRRPVRISWDASAMQMNVTDRAGTQYFRKRAMGSASYGLSAGDVTFSRSPLEVYPNGLANDTLAITITGTNTSKMVRMTRAGIVRVQ